MSQARIYNPTPKKLAEARARGLWPQSRDLVSAVTVLTALLVFWYAGEWMVGRLKESWNVALEAVRAGERASLGSALKSCAWLGVQAIAPLLGATFAVSALASFAQVGPSTSLSTVSAKTDPFRVHTRRNRLPWTDRLVDAGLGCVKTAAIVSVVVVTLLDATRGLINMLLGSPERALDTTAKLGGAILLRAGALLAVIGVLDYMYQRYRFWHGQKMTREEIDRERRETEPDPRVKTARRGLHRRLVNETSGRGPSARS
jgi:flagellar biosynthesis protein FlhB